MTQISILGCGWLGLPLAKALLNENFSVKGSTTSENKLVMLKRFGIEPFLIALDTKNISGKIEKFLEGTQILIINIPPNLRNKSLTNTIDNTLKTNKEFVEKIKILISFIEKSSIQNVLFISSTSVYGATNEMITEETIPNPDTESGSQLWESETLLVKNTNFKTTILRFGGLIGEDRNPVRFLAGKENLTNPKAPINLIHQKDSIGIILKIINTNSWNEIYNGVSPYHPTREFYYTKKAVQLALPLPQFDHSKKSTGKIISSEKIETLLGYTFTGKL